MPKEKLHVHDCFDIDNDIVWAVVTQDLPDLKKKVDDILNREME